VSVTLAQWTAHKRRQRNPIWPSAQIFWNDLAIFAVACAGTLSVNVVGSLPGDEILILILFPFLAINHGERAFRREYLWFYILLGGWLFGTIGGDLYLGISVANKLKGIARIVFFGLDFASLAILIDRKTRGMFVFALGIMVIMFSVSLGYREDLLTQWKYGGGLAVSIATMLLASYFYMRHRYYVCIFLSACLAVLNLINAFRSQIAIDLVSCALVLPIFSRTRENRSGGHLDQREIFRVILLLSLAVGAAWTANEVVKYAVSQNYFNEQIESKFASQSAGQLGVLVGGRPETLVAVQAIIDSPIIGHGSFAVDPKYIQLLQDIQYKYGYSDSDEPTDEDVPSIPTHSHLTQAWVESGILGGIFWIYVLILTLRGLFQLILRRSSLAPIYAFLLLDFLWDILYSPMGSVNRLLGTYYILMSYLLLGASDYRTSALPSLKRHVSTRRGSISGLKGACRCG
jgi:hypothetical protein